MTVGVFAGLCTLDVAHLVPDEATLPGPDQKVTVAEQAVAAGGPATNAAVTFAALGGHAMLVTALGTGVVADIVRADLGACGVDVVDVAPGQRDRVPVSGIRVVGATGQRSVVSTDATGIEAADVAAAREVTAAADVCLVDGHHSWLTDLASGWAAGSGIPVVVDAGRWREAMAAALPRATAVICSADFRYRGTGSVTASARRMVAEGVPAVAVTHGPDPVLWWTADGHGAVDVPPTHAVDTAGAGDAFHGAYCYYSVTRRGAELPELLAASARVATLKCAFFGTRRWLAKLGPDGMQ